MTCFFSLGVAMAVIWSIKHRWVFAMTFIFQHKLKLFFYFICCLNVGVFGITWIKNEFKSNNLYLKELLVVIVDQITVFVGGIVSILFFSKKIIYLYRNCKNY